MSTTTKARDLGALSIVEKRHREGALREALASARIEGGDVTPDAEAIMRECAQGLIDDETAIARIKALHGV